MKPNPEQLQSLCEQIDLVLLPEADIRSLNGDDPVQVSNIPAGWDVIGAGNYAVVFSHKQYANLAIKVYATGRKGLEDEAEVYRRLGKHPAYSECYCVGRGYLVMKRLPGVTLYHCLRQGISIPQSVLDDIDEALMYASMRGLTPRDIHGKNVMYDGSRGYVVDVSDFLIPQPDRMWKDFKRAYKLLYKPLGLKWGVPVPEWLLELLRKGYQIYRRRTAVSTNPRDKGGNESMR
ncbi:serine/threonine protein kinase [Paenibacillus alvei]|uniref:serine/threonine protein kinase n=1 Tax=Paenibacillus alvei TaxID=44250 RepID=UPI0013D95143|nr:serine/threonine protein kinase [Paenibacillus alvei]NEZ41454.1 serine/threonine protein kinase [Paenibacillus alvei]